MTGSGGHEAWKGWQFVSVISVERGTFMSLPRCALVPPATQDQSLVFGENLNNGSLEQQHYQPDNSVRCFRNLGTLATLTDNTISTNDFVAYSSETTRYISMKPPCTLYDLVHLGTPQQTSPTSTGSAGFREWKAASRPSTIRALHHFRRLLRILVTCRALSHITGFKLDNLPHRPRWSWACQRQATCASLRWI
jgi:hypothetical protein